MIWQRIKDSWVFQMVTDPFFWLLAVAFFLIICGTLNSAQNTTVIITVPR